MHTGGLLPSQHHSDALGVQILTLNRIDLGACPYCGGRKLLRKPLSLEAATARAAPELGAA